MENLNGGIGNGDDRFMFTDSGVISGVIDAGDHTNGDIVDYSLLTNVVVDLSNGINGIQNAEIVQGNNIQSILYGNDTANYWLINGENDGTLNDVEFIDFNQLIGGSLADIFTYPKVVQ